MFFPALLASAWAAAAEPAVSSTSPVILAAVGDISLDGPVGALIAKGVSNPTAGLAQALLADITFGNLECALTVRGSKEPKTWNFRAPPGRLKALQKAGFNLLNLANNHSWDFGETGFLDTLAALRKQSLPIIGGGRDLAEAEKIKILTVRGLRVGFMGFTSTFPKAAWAGRDKPGVAYSDFKRLPGLLRLARENCDLLIASLRGGTELADEPNEIQRAFARLAIDHGADLVLGHHPHVLQGLELYRDKPIAYSLGNFLFVSPTTSTHATVVLRAQLSRSGVERIDFIAADTNWGRPIPASPAEAQSAYERLNRYGVLSEHPGRFRLVTTTRD